MGEGKKADPPQGLVALSGNGGEVGDLAHSLLQGWEETGRTVIADRRETVNHLPDSQPPQLLSLLIFCLEDLTFGETEALIAPIMVLQ